jgi:hypothetical protein
LQNKPTPTTERVILEAENNTGQDANKKNTREKSRKRVNKTDKKRQRDKKRQKE